MALATFLSRLLGLVREMLASRILGGGTLMTAWGLAFTVANIFRRLFGEGAAGTAIVPIISHSLIEKGKDLTKQKLAVILSTLGIILSIICICTGIGSYVISHYISTPRWHLALATIPIIIPYAFFICMTGAITSILNSLGRFFFPALLALLLNIFIIGMLLLIFCNSPFSPQSTLTSLSLAVIASGIIQFILILILLKKENMLPTFSVSSTLTKSTLQELWQLTLPGLIGASALQVSLIADRTLACWLSDYAVPSLIFSDRIVYLPIGIFAVSIGTVALSNMSRSAAQKDWQGMLSAHAFCLRLLLYICIPTALFIIFYRYQLIEAFFFGGKFGNKEVKETALALKFYALGIPAFASLKVTLAMFHSRKNMKTPVKVSICCILLNLALNLILMWPLQQGGLALATVLASFCNNIALLTLLKKDFPSINLDVIPVITKSLISAISALLLTYTIDQLIIVCPTNTLWLRMLNIIIIVTIFLILYFLLGLLLKAREPHELVSIFKHRFFSTKPVSEKQ